MSVDEGHERRMAPGWRFAPTTRMWVGGNDDCARRVVNAMIGQVVRPPTGPLDAVVVTPLSGEECAYFMAKVLPRLEPDGRLWVVCAESDSLPAEAIDAAADRLGLTRVGHHPLADGYQATAFDRVHGRG